MNNRQEALERIAICEEEMAKLKKIIKEPIDYIKEKVNSYSEVCKLLNEKEYTLSDFNWLPEYLRKKMLVTTKINQIAKLFNGDWKLEILDSNQEKWFPYFDIKAGVGLVFYGSSYGYYASVGQVVYLRDKRTSDYIGNSFIEIYREFYS